MSSVGRASGRSTGIFVEVTLIVSTSVFTVGLAANDVLRSATERNVVAESESRSATISARRRAGRILGRGSVFRADRLTSVTAVTERLTSVFLGCSTDSSV